MSASRPPTPAKAKPAENERQFKALMRSDPRKTAFIRTLDEWHTHVTRARDDRESPLRAIDAKLLKSFEESLVFGKRGGLAGARYGGLASRLTFNQFWDLMGLFGIGMGYFADHNNKYCAERATCRVEMAAICTSNC